MIQFSFLAGKEDISLRGAWKIHICNWKGSSMPQCCHCIEIVVISVEGNGMLGKSERNPVNTAWSSKDKMDVILIRK